MIFVSQYLFEVIQLASIRRHLSNENSKIKKVIFVSQYLFEVIQLASIGRHLSNENSKINKVIFVSQYLFEVIQLSSIRRHLSYENSKIKQRKWFSFPSIFLRLYNCHRSGGIYSTKILKWKKVIFVSQYLFEVIQLSSIMEAFIQRKF